MRVGKRKNCYDLAACAASVCAVSRVTQAQRRTRRASIIYVVRSAPNPAH